MVHPKYVIYDIKSYLFSPRNNILLSESLIDDPFKRYIKETLFQTFFLTLNELASEPHQSTLKLSYVVRLDIIFSLIEEAC